MNGLHFAHPHFLWALAVLPFLAALIFHAEKMRRIALDRLIAARLQPRLAGSVSVTRRRWGFALLLLGIGLSLLALARPQWGFTWEEKRQSGRDIIIAIDTSKSMLATDLLPNRLTRAKLAAEDLLNQLEGDRVGLLAFAGSSFLQAPLTADFGAVRETVQELDTDIIPRGGTNLSDAIKAADEAFGKGESEHRALIIFSDGEELEADAVVSARESKDRFHIFTVGLGSADGSLIPVPTTGGGTEFLKDDQGQYVKSKLDEPRMREVAEAGGGFYVHLQNGPAEMQQIVRDGLGKMKEHETEARFTKVPVERYQWPLGGAMACIITAMLLGERRRQGMAQAAKIAAAVLVFSGMPADARQAGIEKFEAKDYAGSLGEFDGELKKRDVAELHFNAGSAAYELGDYARAADSFSRALGTAKPELKGRAAYNLANTLARRGVKHEKKEDKLGDLKDAVKQYDEVLKSDPKHEDARHNRDLVAKLIAELEKEEKQDKKDQKDQQKDEDKKDDQKKDQQDKQDSSQGGKDKDDKKDEQQKMDGSGKDEKSEQGKKDEKEQQSKDGKDGEKKDSQEKKDGEQSQQKDGKNDPVSEKKNGEQQKPDDKEGDKPKPQPKDGENEKQKTGEVKAANPGQQEEPGKEDPAAEAAEAAQAAKESRMTEKDAAQILEALKRVDRRVRLLDPKTEPQKTPNKPFKNW
ncbi:MAG: VWA domain-containing protein [Chthoniobacteraceae bacterium]